MSKVLAVFGVTGTQGGSVVNHVLSDAVLSKQYKIRGITRNVDSEQANKLKANIDLVPGDVADRASLEKAFTGVDTVFIMTTPAFGPDAVEVEYNNAKSAADVAVEKGVKYIIFSTLPSPSDISGGKYTAISPFEAKAKAEKYIRGLPVKSAFFAGAFFMENFESQPFLAPQPQSDGTWVMSRPTSSKIEIPLIDATRDTGKFVGAILAEPDKYEGKTFCAAEGMYSWEKVVAIMSKATGKTVLYKQISLEEFKKTLPVMVDVFAEGSSYQQEFDYFGPDSKEKIAWATENVHGKLRSLEEYFQANPFHLL